jgi:trehalose 2-sulfotransferase
MGPCGALDAYADWVRNPSLPAARTQPRASYVICTTPRSGSWLLCGLLASTGVAGRPHEWFLEAVEDTAGREWGARDFSEYVRLVQHAGTTPNGVFGAKVMWASFEHLLERLRHIDGNAPDERLIERRFQKPRFVWLHRDDSEAQAASWARAIQTGVWAHWDTPTAPAAAETPLDSEQVAALAAVARAHNEAWQGWFESHHIEPIDLRFEDLVTDPIGAATGVLDRLGLASDTMTPLTMTTHDLATARLPPNS